MSNRRAFAIALLGLLVPVIVYLWLRYRPVGAPLELIWQT